MRKPKSRRNNGQSDLSDYASSISFSVKLSDQIVNHSCRHSHKQYHTWPKCHSLYIQDYVYQESVETSSVQSQNQKYLVNRENQYIDMTHVSRRF